MANAALPRVNRRGRDVPDLNLLHFCLWRHQNSAVYAAEVSDVPFLQTTNTE
jgi:hypothetical protein